MCALKFQPRLLFQIKMDLTVSWPLEEIMTVCCNIFPSMAVDGFLVDSDLSLSFWILKVSLYRKLACSPFFSFHAIV